MSRLSRLETLPLDWVLHARLEDADARIRLEMLATVAAVDAWLRMARVPAACTFMSATAALIEELNPLGDDLWLSLLDGPADDADLLDRVVRAVAHNTLGVGAVRIMGRHFLVVGNNATPAARRYVVEVATFAQLLCYWLMHANPTVIRDDQVPPPLRPVVVERLRHGRGPPPPPPPTHSSTL